MVVRNRMPRGDGGRGKHGTSAWSGRHRHGEARVRGTWELVRRHLLRGARASCRAAGRVACAGARPAGAKGAGLGDCESRLATSSTTRVGDDPARVQRTPGPTDRTSRWGRVASGSCCASQLAMGRDDATLSIQARLLQLAMASAVEDVHRASAMLWDGDSTTRPSRVGSRTAGAPTEDDGARPRALGAHQARLCPCSQRDPVQLESLSPISFCFEPHRSKCMEVIDGCLSYN